jgi:FAD/FMN-containing dehydrogenase
VKPPLDLDALPPALSILRPGEPGISAYRSDVVLEGDPDAVLRPRSEAEVADILRWADDRGIGVTPAGGQTSLTGSSVALDGVLLATERMDRLVDVGRDPETGEMRATAEAGIFLGDFQRALEADGWLYPPDPTSRNEARLGATVATNATGEDTLLYGPTRRWIRELRVVRAGGSVVTLRRGGAPPREEKGSAGFDPAAEPMDWVIGSEGTLGVVTRVTVALAPLPAGTVAGLAFFPSLRGALEFVSAARNAPGITPRALELLDRGSLDLAGDRSEGIHWPPETAAAILFKSDLEAPHDRDRVLEAWLALLGRWLSAAFLDRVLVFATGSERERLRAFRHHVPARLNERIAGFRGAGGGKVGTDWWVPYPELPDFLERWMGRIAEAGLEAVVFGHAGNGHPHVNFIAFDADRLRRARELAVAMCREAVARGGGVAGEHGIGKLKRELLGIQHDAARIEAMRAVKADWDPRGIMAPGNLFPPPAR